MKSFTETESGGMGRGILLAVTAGAAALLVVIALLQASGGETRAGMAAQPRITVNQVGYVPDGPKRATLITQAQTALAWRLLDAEGKEVASGMTRPAGVDPTARLNVHVIDFSGFTQAGEGYRIEADGEVSFPFAIGRGFYEALARDALNYFYPVRSGIAIDGAIAGEAYARPAGHISAPGKARSIRATGASLAFPRNARNGFMGFPGPATTRWMYRRLVRRGRSWEISGQWRHFGRPAHERL